MDENTLNDLLGTAKADQAEAGLKAIAHQLAVYRDALLIEGFTRQEALILVRAWQGELMETVRRRGA
jgi:molybdopterin-guanine dinucleotide biosynthesis protein